MAGYLVARGIAANRMIPEGRSTSTEENLVFSRRLLEGQGVDATDPIVLVTSDFHVRRAVQIAGKAGFGNVAGVLRGVRVRFVLPHIQFLSHSEAEHGRDVTLSSHAGPAPRVEHGLECVLLVGFADLD
ncbi:YdcF family protein [Cupriavidus oxalaticus]|uniref:YdcF family protein n=1 Tax=Cupriavidus oxalaticus TaxID=96344 RepID=UPI00403493E9